jgi:hypothetical protein
LLHRLLRMLLLLVRVRLQRLFMLQQALLLQQFLAQVVHRPLLLLFLCPQSHGKLVLLLLRHRLRLLRPQIRLLQLLLLRLLLQEAGPLRLLFGMLEILLQGLLLQNLWRRL